MRNGRIMAALRQFDELTFASATDRKR